MGLSLGRESEYNNARIPALDYRWPACACRTQTGGATGKINVMFSERTYIRKTRYAAQLFFLLLTIFIGYNFYRFVLHFINPVYPYVQRPPSVDAFLPIGGFMAFKYFLLTGIIEPVHPSGFILFVAVVLVSMLMKKGFCGWICPIGTVSQYFWMAGERIFGRGFTIEKHTDMGLRSLKYVLMSLFLILIGIAMTPNMMVLFFITDYYKTADVRMMRFFTNMSAVTMWVLIALGILSLFYKNFWCRYLCPYGALLGLVSLISPVKIRRNAEKCNHCRSCSIHCPTSIDVEKKEVVSSPECFGCMTCISRCPAEGALDITFRAGKKLKVLRPYLYPAILVIVFYMVIGVGVLSGKWHSQVPNEDYERIIPQLIHVKNGILK
ncbi:putative electron transport protein YccM [bacterium BMS3Bbin05]|nr:putative electron transport protein YccM [bacterium BMS3Bbin05]HDL20616.1 4Fe-4S binding protein [Nitrospirota bacterium]